VEELAGKRAVDADLLKGHRRVFSCGHYQFPLEFNFEAQR